MLCYPGVHRLFIFEAAMLTLFHSRPSVKEIENSSERLQLMLRNSPIVIKMYVLVGIISAHVKVKIFFILYF